MRAAADETPMPGADTPKHENADRIYRIDEIFSPFPDGREKKSSAEGGADSFVPASGRDKNIRSILLILSSECVIRFYLRTEEWEQAGTPSRRRNVQYVNGAFQLGD